MDRHFLEFWGNLLLSTAAGQRQVEEFARWMEKGMRGVAEMEAMFRRAYGFGSEGREDAETLNKARTTFEQAYRAYLDALGVVPKSDYLKLQEQCAELRRKVQEQEATLRKLQLELSRSQMAQGDAVRGFQNLIDVQCRQFSELTESFSRLLAAPPT
ncbi:MAG: hypothetical protein EHM15_08445, partial [Desulfobacteraceae bacterium]